MQYYARFAKKSRGGLLFRENNDFVFRPDFDEARLYREARFAFFRVEDANLALGKLGDKRNVAVKNRDFARRGARNYFFRLSVKKRFFDCVDPEFHIHKVPIHHSHILKNVRMIEYYSVMSSIPPFI